jgi:hypothetical protein
VRPPPQRHGRDAHATCVHHSPFCSFFALSDWLHARVGQTHGIALGHLFDLLFTYLTGVVGHDRDATAQVLWRDYQRGGRSDRPAFLKPYVPEPPPKTSARTRLPRRQARHLA